jgi:Domain of unknown function (DUF4372)
MNTGKTLFAQVMDFLPWKTFQRIADRYEADRRVRMLSCVEQFRVMAFTQLCYRESLRDIESDCPSAHAVRWRQLRSRSQSYGLRARRDDH